MTAPPSRRSTLKRWLLALLLLAAMAWGLGEMRDDRGTKPELGVGDLRQSEEPAVVQPSEPEESAAARPRPPPRSVPAGDSKDDEVEIGGADGARAADR